MIAPGDKIAVGVSGSKDSLLLLYAMALYHNFSPHPFQLYAVTLTMGLEPFDLTGIRALCRQLDVPYLVKANQQVIFQEQGRKSTPPCAPRCAGVR